jgi:hypothetical protein
MLGGGRSDAFSTFLCIVTTKRQYIFTENIASIHEKRVYLRKINEVEGKTDGEIKTT